MKNDTPVTRRDPVVLLKGDAYNQYGLMLLNEYVEAGYEIKAAVPTAATNINSAVILFVLQLVRKNV